MSILIGILTGIALLAAIIGGLVWIMCGSSGEMDHDDEPVIKQIEKWRNGR